MKYVAFDLDGVLIDALHIHRDAFLDAWNHHAVQEHTIDSSFHDQHLSSLSTKQKIVKLIHHFKIKTPIEQLVFDKKQQLTSTYIDKAPPTTPWICDLIRQLKSEGRRLALVSNSIHSTCERVLINLSILNCFDAVIGSDDVRFNKPSAYPYQVAASRLQTPVADLIVVEDSVTGLRSARAAGCWIYVVDDPLKDLQQTKFKSWLKIIDAV
jgi:HAD superfamily hydrolase (TIGR01509 family)